MAAALLPGHLLRARLDLSPLHSSFDIILVNRLLGSVLLAPSHARETKAQTGSVTCLRSHSQDVGGSRLKPGPFMGQLFSLLLVTSAIPYLLL